MALKDWIYSETGDACALCGCRDRDSLTVHHIDDDPKNNVYANTIVLCHNCHVKHHQGKGISTADITERKRHLVMTTLTQHGLNALKIAYRKPFGVVAMPFLLNHLIELGYMKKMETQMTYGDDSEECEVTARFVITTAGRSLLEQYGVKRLQKKA